mmetsp:Transcript_38283/g.44596  ORF Transcript_38283/g.44596 Transcript_38283/m.44596 type:complete len:91 (-) Transcript_38283:20-292(-)
MVEMLATDRRCLRNEAGCVSIAAIRTVSVWPNGDKDDPSILTTFVVFVKAVEGANAVPPTEKKEMISAVSPFMVVQSSKIFLGVSGSCRW